MDLVFGILCLGFGILEFEIFYCVLGMGFEVRNFGFVNFALGIWFWDSVVRFGLLVFGVWNFGFWSIEFAVLCMGFGDRSLEI